MTVPQTLKLDWIVQRDPDVIAAEADQDLVMVSIVNGAYYGVSDVAREIWEAIEHPKKISERLGHSSIKLTMDTYGHLFEGSDRDSAEKIEKLLGPKSKASESGPNSRGQLHVLPKTAS